MAGEQVWGQLFISRTPLGGNKQLTHLILPANLFLSHPPDPVDFISRMNRVRCLIYLISWILTSIFGVGKPDSGGAGMKT